MTYKDFLAEYSKNGLIKRQKPDFVTVEKMVLRAGKDLNTAKANLSIDEGIAYTVAYLAMLRAAKAFMLLKGFRPDDGYQHKTVVEFIALALGEEYSGIIDKFDIMRRKRNIFTYEIDVVISRTEADKAFGISVEFVDIIKKSIRKENPQIQFKF